MPTAVVERWGSLSATGLAREPAFATVTTPSSFLPMTGNSLELDPGLFAPKVMMGQRDVNIFPLYGQYKNAGSVQGALFPTNGGALIPAAIGADAAAGYGVTGSTPTSSTTTSAPVTAGATTVTLTSAAGYSVGGIVQVDVNNTTTPTTAECRKIVSISTNTLTVDQAFTYAHASGATVAVVVAPFTHSVQQANALPSLTVEKNLGGYESLQFSGARVNKFGLQVTNANQEATVTADLQAKHAGVLTTPSSISAINEAPYVFAETTLTLNSQAVAQATSADLTIENGLKDTYTFNSSHELAFLTPLTRTISFKADLVFTSLDDPTWGYWTQMGSGTDFSITLALTHPSSAGTVAFTMPKARIKTYSDAVKLDDVILSTLTFDVFLNLTTLQTISASVVNSQYLPL
ncbi:phage tail tube protein [Streptomyces sp. NPDC001404]|uniref:phage tail tube protein n=1 Tax=Streptomyces sp. NPDC001404 TaxID=3364571 RepID=UPI0036BEDF3A